MHYTAGLSGLTSLGGAGLLAQRAGAGPLAVLLLEGSGACFAVYVAVMLTLSLMGVFLHRRTGGRADRTWSGAGPGVASGTIPARHAR